MNCKKPWVQTLKNRVDKGKIRNDLTGKVFNKLTVLSFDSWVIQGKNTRVYYWLCKCECSKTCKVKGTHLSRGDTKSCGCYKPHMLPKGEASFNLVFNSYKRHAKNRNYEWFLTKDEFKILTKQNCLYCNQVPKNSMISIRGNGEYIYNGIDRKNNEPYYKVENTVPCCSTCNWMKSDMTFVEFKIHIERINNVTNPS